MRERDRRDREGKRGNPLDYYTDVSPSDSSAMRHYLLTKVELGVFTRLYDMLNHTLSITAEPCSPWVRAPALPRVPMKSDLDLLERRMGRACSSVVNVVPTYTLIQTDNPFCYTSKKPLALVVSAINARASSDFQAASGRLRKNNRCRLFNLAASFRPYCP